MVAYRGIRRLGAAGATGIGGGRVGGGREVIKEGLQAKPSFYRFIGRVKFVVCNFKWRGLSLFWKLRR